MRVAIDARTIDGRPTGISCYVRTLLEALAGLPGDDRYLLLRRSVGGAARLVADPRFEEHSLREQDDLWMEVNLDRLLGEWEADLYHATLAAPPVVAPCPTLMTVHDVIPRVMPKFVEAPFLAYFQDRIAPGFRRASHLLAVSSHTAHDLTHRYGIAPGRISVVLEAAPPTHTVSVPLSEAKLVWASHGIRQPYLLCVGAVEPRKNTGRLLEAFRLLRRGGRRDAQLVLVGAARDRSTDLVREVESACRELPVVWLQEVSASALCALYTGASAFVFPSLYEGFGLPVLEAMSHGLPVIVSFVSSLPEVVGDAGLLIGPYDAGAIAEGLERVLSDAGLRTSLGEQARRRAAEFSLRRMGEGTLAAYRKAVEARR